MSHIFERSFIAKTAFRSANKIMPDTMATNKLTNTLPMMMESLYFAEYRYNKKQEEGYFIIPYYIVVIEQ